MKFMYNKAIILACLGSVFCLPAHGDLQSAFDDLVDGRSYRNGFYLPTADRDTMVTAFLAGEPESLRDAIDEAMTLRLSSGVSEQVYRDAGVIKNEALEAMLYGYLSAGNRDLLKGTRVAFPSGIGVTETRNNPHGFFASNSGTAPGENRIPEEILTSIRSLSYAELYFAEGVKEALAVLQNDPSGRVRAIDISVAPDANPSLPYFTRWTVYLPELEDAHPDLDFVDQQDQWSMTGAALLGKSVRRYGGTAVTIADKLWRAAFFNPDVQNDREAVLSEAASHLKCSMHAQFLASLPIAATLNDGLASEPDENGDVALTRNEYQEVGADVVRVNVTAAQILLGRIARGERPKQVDLVSKWDRATINKQISDVNGLKAACVAAWSDTETKVNQLGSALQIQAGDRDLRRSRYEFRLWQITGIHPANHNGVGFKDGDGVVLGDEDAREAYLEFIRSFVEDKTTNFNPTDAWFTTPISGGADPAGGSPVSSVSDLGIATLRMMQAINEIKVAKARIDAIPQRIAIEDKRNNTVNKITTNQGSQIAALDLSEALAGMFEYTACTCGIASGVSVKINAGTIVRAAQLNTRNLINTSAATGVNNANSKAVIENLLVEQGILVEQFQSTVIQAQLAITEVKRLYSEAQQIVEDYQYHVDSTNELWYNDPELVFEQSAAEKRYEGLVSAYKGELYILAKMLEKAWVEPYENPVRSSQSGAYVNISLNVAHGDYPDAESVFSAGNHLKCDDFFAALEEWSDWLAQNRGGVEGGFSSSLNDAVVVSLRQDILGLTDHRFNAAASQFEYDPVLSHENVRKFRAFMLRQHKAALMNGYNMRINFPVDLMQKQTFDGLTNPVFVYRSLQPGNSGIWNHRAIGFGVQFAGRGLTQDSRIPVTVMLNGEVTREGKFHDSIYTKTNIAIKSNLKLQQYDPYEITIAGKDGFFKKEQVLAVVNNEPVPGTGDMPPIQWPLMCDEWVILIDPTATSNMNWENIDDVILYFFWEAGSPVSLGNNYLWP